MKAIIYARCSTDEKRQDVDIQTQELKDYCDRQGWDYDVVQEYSSASKEVPEKLRKLLAEIKNKHYDIFLVYDLTRFSRLHPTTTSKMMDYIVEQGCRFLSLQDNLDSKDEIKWLVIKPIFQYLAWVYSRNLSEKVKLGMKKKMKEGKHCGRPKGSKDKKRRSKKGYYLKGKESLPF